LSSSGKNVALHTYDDKVRATVGGSTDNPSYGGSWALLLDSTQSLTTSTWFHIVVTYNMSGNAQIYINGNADNSGPIENPQTSWDTGARCIGEGEGLWNGKISNLSIYSSVLTQDQVLTIYNGGVPNDISSLSPASWWSLAGDSYYDGTNWICPDLGSGSNNGTSANMAGTELVGDGPGSTANGIATSMDIPANLKGNAPSSSKNAFSVNMNSADRVTSVPG